MSDTFEMKRSEMYENCYSCEKRINLGDSMRYTTSGYTTYCTDPDCTDGVATSGTALEECWYGNDEMIILEDE